ncbi:MAG: tetratricopeptide repeat protein, partial [Deltaproteobacteria bacterium]
GNRLMIGVCVVSLAASGIIFWIKRERGANEAAWRELSSAFASTKPEDFYDVWEAHPGTPTGLWARTQEGERRLRLGVERLFDNLDAGQEELHKARKAFQTVVDDRRAPADAREQALMGLGRTLESLSETADAVKAYESLVKEFPTSLYKDDAEERINLLKQSNGQEFYAWFSKYPRPKLKEKRPFDKFGEGADESENWLENIRKLESDVESSGLKPPADDGEAPKLPDEEKSDDKTGDAGSGAKSLPDGEPKPESVPESKPDAGKKPAPDSKSDEQ